MALDLDDAVRSAAFAFLADQQRLRDERWPPVIPRHVLAAGLTFDGRRVPLLGPEGIFKPAILPTIPLSITTAPPKLGRPAPYDDAFGYGHLIYRYRGTDARHPDNVGLRIAMSQGKPLVYFHGIIPGQYLSVWPVYVTADVPTDLAFQVAFDPGDTLDLPDFVEDEARRSYALRLVRQRLHQVSFRERVLAAYRRTCAVCRLRHVELLDAAHIIPDGRPRGEPVVPNGLALCKLHHAAFDNNIIGIRPDLGIEVRSDVLAEIDGPMLLHGIHGIQGSLIWTPRSTALRPTAERLEERYAEFRRAS